jgi:hypothetical protein
MPRPLILLEGITQRNLGKTRTRCTGGWVGLRAGLDGCGQSSPQRVSIPGPFRRLRAVIPTELSRRTLENGNLQFMFQCFLIYICARSADHCLICLQYWSPQVYRFILNFETGRSWQLLCVFEAKTFLCKNYVKLLFSTRLNWVEIWARNQAV